MKKEHLLYGSLGVLVLLNIILLSSMFFKGKHREHHRWDRREDLSFPSQHPPGMHGDMDRQHQEIFDELLNLNEKQKQAFDTEIAKHMEQMHTLLKEKIQLKKALLKSLQGNPNKEIKDSLINNILLNEKNISHNEYEHFYTLKSLLDDTQKEKFDTTLGRMMIHRGREMKDIGFPPPPPAQ